MCTRARPPSHFYIVGTSQWLPPGRDSGALTIFIILEFLPESIITWEDFVPDTFIYIMCATYRSRYSKNCRVKALVLSFIIVKGTLQ